MNTNSFSTAAPFVNPDVARRSWPPVAAAAVAALMAVTSGHAAAADAPGATYTYRLINGYNNEVQGQVVYRVDRVDADRISFSVTPDTPSAGAARTEIYTKDGNWVRRPIVNHDQQVDYEFPTAYPAYVFPLDKGKTWSIRVDAVNPANGRRNSVRIDGQVLGAERVSVPAGEFEAIKVQRLVYAGDWDPPLQETNIVEIDWYVPALGRAVKTQSSSAYLDKRMGVRNQAVRGDRPVYELVSTSR